MEMHLVLPVGSLDHRHRKWLRLSGKPLPLRTEKFRAPTHHLPLVRLAPQWQAKLHDAGGGGGLVYSGTALLGRTVWSLTGHTHQAMCRVVAKNPVSGIHYSVGQATYWAQQKITAIYWVLTMYQVPCWMFAGISSLNIHNHLHSQLVRHEGCQQLSNLPWPWDYLNLRSVCFPFALRFQHIESVFSSVKWGWCHLIKGCFLD